MSINEFLAQKPSVSVFEILQYVETEAQRIAAEQKQAQAGAEK